MSKLIAVCLTVAGIIFTLPAIALPILPDAKREIQDALRRSDNSLQHKDIAGYIVGFSSDFQGEDIKNHYLTHSR